MSGYVQFDFDESYEDLLAASIARVAGLIPGWVPREGHPEVAFLEESARIASDTRALVVNVAASVFATFGQDLLGVPKIAGVQAQLMSTWTVIDTLGHVLPAGTIVSWQPPSGDPIFFQVAQDVTIPVGDSSVSNVLLLALLAGTAANAVTAGPLSLVDSLAWVATVVADEAAEGGVDPETDLAYLNRLAAQLQTLRRAPVIPADYGVLATSTAGVFRALGVDGWNPNDGTTGNERTVGVAAVDSTGQPVSDDIAAQMIAALAAEREVNFQVFAGQPTYTAVHIAFSVVPEDTADPADVLAAVTAAAQALIDPGTFAGGAGTPPSWTGQHILRYLKVAQVLGSVPGVAFLPSLTLNGTPGDLVLSGVAPLPAGLSDPSNPSTVTGTVITP